MSASNKKGLKKLVLVADSDPFVYLVYFVVKKLSVYSVYPVVEMKSVVVLSASVEN